MIIQMVITIMMVIVRAEATVWRKAMVMVMDIVVVVAAVVSVRAMTATTTAIVLAIARSLVTVRAWQTAMTIFLRMIKTISLIR